jgi:hypothetical protein
MGKFDRMVEGEKAEDRKAPASKRRKFLPVVDKVGGRGEHGGRKRGKGGVPYCCPHWHLFLCTNWWVGGGLLCVLGGGMLVGSRATVQSCGVLAGAGG